MYGWIFSWVSGSVAFSMLGILSVSTLAIALGLVTSGAVWRWPKIRWLCFFICGFLYAAWRAQQVLALQLPIEQSNRLFHIQALAMPSYSGADSNLSNNVYTFEDIVASNYAGAPIAFAKLSIRSYSAFQPTAYQRCAFYARLKAPIGKRNPGGRNVESAYFQRKISALGYVVEHPANHCESGEVLSMFSRMRAKLIRAFDQTDINLPSKAILKALAVAERGGLSELQWQVFRQTGTSHLLAISGLHIMLCAGLVFTTVRTTLLLCCTARQRTLVTDIALVASLLGAFFYVAMANFTLPAQRALMMVFVSVTALLLRKSVVSYRSLLLAAFVLLLVEPATALSIGFWLSFGAVTILLLMRGTRPSGSWFLSALRTHFFLSVGLLPVTCFLTNTVPLSAPFANLFAVPIVSLVVVPLVLLGSIAACLGVAVYAPCWGLAAWVWEYVWWILHSLESWVPDIAMASQPNKLQLLLVLLGIVLMLIPIFPRRWVFIFACLFQFMLRHGEVINPQEFRVLVLDVGQGLAVITQTAKHVLVYDTGPSFGHYSAGKTVILPALESLGEAKLDRVVVSHGDNDHQGGYAQLRAGIEIESELVSTDLAGPNGENLCRRGQSWSWDGVTFDILSPPSGALGSKNDLSCVLRIHSPFGSVLLPGDIEKLTESELLETYGSSLASEVLLAPHHGSNTSSTKKFVEMIRPRYVIFAAGFFNRFNFPNQAVYDRYIAAGSETMITSELGAIEVFIRKQDIFVSSERRQHLKWRFIGSTVGD